MIADHNSNIIYGSLNAHNIGSAHYFYIHKIKLLRVQPTSKIQVGLHLSVDGFTIIGF